MNINFTTAGDSYVFRVSNAGVGPARIRSFRVLIDGEPVHTWADAKQALTGDPGQGRGDEHRSVDECVVDPDSEFRN